MRNYRTIENYGVGFPKQHSQFSSVLSSGSNPGGTLTASNRVGNTVTTPSDRPVYDEATLIIYNSKNIPKVEVAFKDIFPTSLSGLAYAQDATDVEYFRADATFRFMYYEFKNAT